MVFLPVLSESFFSASIKLKTTFEKRPVGKYCIVDLPVWMGLREAFELKSLIETECPKGNFHVALNLAKMNHIESHTVSLFIFAKKFLDSLGGSFTLIAPSGVIREVLETTGLPTVIRVLECESILEQNT